MIEIYLPDGERVSFHPVSREHFRGPQLPGSRIMASRQKDIALHIQEETKSLFTLHCRIIQLTEEKSLLLNEQQHGIRLEILLAGKLLFNYPDNNTFGLTQGQYHFTDAGNYTSIIQQDNSCILFVAYYSPEYLKSLGMETELQPCSPQNLPKEMQEVVSEMLNNPYVLSLQGFYYDNCLRKLLFLHLAAHPATVPDKLSEGQLATIYQADLSITSVSAIHPTIELSHHHHPLHLSINKRFAAILNSGAFERLIQRRMDKAALLLETTAMPIKAVAEKAGYQTVAGFIIAFGKRYKMTPVAWRNKKSGLVI